MADQNTPSQAIPIRTISVGTDGVPLVGGGSAVTIADNGNAVEGVTTGAAVVTDANGTIHDYLRGLVKTLAVTGSVAASGLSTAVSGRQTVTTAGTAVQFTLQACKVVALTAETDNTGYIVIGDSAVVAALATRKGLPLAAGDTAIFSVSNMNVLYMDSTVSTDGVTWAVLN